MSIWRVVAINDAGIQAELWCHDGEDLRDYLASSISVRNLLRLALVVSLY